MTFFRNKRLFLLLIGIIILVVLIGFSLNDRQNVSLPEKIVMDTVGWAQQIVHAPADFVVNIFTNIRELTDAHKENQILKERLAQQQGLQYELQILQEDNEELRKILDKTESIRDFNPIQATVISRSPERWIEQVIINKGSQHGVEQNMAVMTADGMIGKIQATAENTSTVQLLTGFDQFNRISATIYREEGNDVFGLIEEFDKESNSLLFKIIEESDKSVEQGDVVMSSGKGGIFPAGLMIGTVREVVPDQYGLTSTALVKPAADMYDIHHVIVVDPVLSYDEGSDG